MEGRDGVEPLALWGPILAGFDSFVLSDAPPVRD